MASGFDNTCSVLIAGHPCSSAYVGVRIAEERDVAWGWIDHVRPFIDGRWVVEIVGSSLTNSGVSFVWINHSFIQFAPSPSEIGCSCCSWRSDWKPKIAFRRLNKRLNLELVLHSSSSILYSDCLQSPIIEFVAGLNRLSSAQRLPHHASLVFDLSQHWLAMEESPKYSCCEHVKMISWLWRRCDRLGTEPPHTGLQSVELMSIAPI